MRVEAVASARSYRVGVGLEPARPDDEVHAERLRPACQLLGDVAEAEQPEGPAVEAPRLRELLLVPAAGPQLGDVVGDPTVEGEDQPEGELGDRDRVLARAVRDVDPAGRGGGDIDRVVAGAGADDEGEVAAVHHRRASPSWTARSAPRPGSRGGRRRARRP